MFLRAKNALHHPLSMYAHANTIQINQKNIYFSNYTIYFEHNRFGSNDHWSIVEKVKEENWKSFDEKNNTINQRHVVLHIACPSEQINKQTSKQIKRPANTLIHRNVRKVAHTIVKFNWSTKYIENSTVNSTVTVTLPHQHIGTCDGIVFV